ncbi:membrane protein [Cupriavidus sp. SK-4]|uniref:hypothetical protein n=1 Tax=Cupriavidus sp. SK-4 TaxID=574750 RepID=UPI0004492500|nr:hypothetical protein [Cupriavidus sp. SK-4]EYS89239.1 membrane protein [Cupriavidus sp. SK-4]
MTRAANPRTPAFRRGRRRRLALYVVSALLLGSALPTLALRAAHADPAQWLGWTAWSMKLHGAAAFAALFLLGTLWPTHMRAAWLRRHNRLAGGMFAAATAVTVATGYGLYYFNGETLRSVSDGLHWGSGLAAAWLFVVHRRAGRREGRRGSGL